MRRVSSTSVLLALSLVASACGSASDIAQAPSSSATSSSAPVSVDDSGSAVATTTVPPATTERSVATTATSAPSSTEAEVVELVLGVEQLVASDFAALDGQRVGLITNQVSVVDGRHLIDWLAEAPNVELVSIFAAEHGVRGVAGAGEPIGDGVDDATGTPIRSLYGATRQPTPAMLADIDTLVFDLQDVGARFYTYTATMGLAMQTAAAEGVRFVVLDRPNPLGRIVEGDLRTDAQVSFISQFPTPSLHGLTSGELARMMVGEAWLPGLTDLELEVVEMTGWDEAAWSDESIWIPPSPGLQTAASAITYPAIVWFEATTLSYAAGTDLAFQAVGAPWLDAAAVVADLEGRDLPGVTFSEVELRPVDIVDVAADPRFEGEVLPGVRLTVTDAATFRPSAIGLHLLEAIIASAPGQTVIDRGAVFDLLAGTAEVRQQLRNGVPVSEIVADWPDIAAEFEARSFPYRSTGAGG